MYSMKWMVVRVFIYTVAFTAVDVFIRHRPFLPSLLYSAVASVIVMALFYGVQAFFKRK